MKKVIGILLVVLMLATSVTAFAGEVTAPGSGTSEVPLTAAATTFSVTVPMSLPISVSATGVVTAATSGSAKIVNNSYGRVKVTDVVITGANSWEIIPFSTDMSTVAVNSKKIGLQLNTVGTTTAYAFDVANFPAMAGTNATNSDEIGLTYDAVVPAQSTPIAGDTVANVVFTFAWDN